MYVPEVFAGGTGPELVCDGCYWRKKSPHAGGIRFVIRRFCGLNFGLALICPVALLRRTCVARARAGLETSCFSRLLVVPRCLWYIELVAPRNILRGRVVNNLCMVVDSWVTHVVRRDGWRT